MTYLNRGGLPAVYLSDDYIEELRAYTALYLKEEIQNERITHDKIAIFPWKLFLEKLWNGDII